MSVMIETDERSEVLGNLPGHPSQRFLVQENEDGSVLLSPAGRVPTMQEAYDTDPVLRELLDRAMTSPRVVREYRYRV
jgi:hypothetical protein